MLFIVNEAGGVRILGWPASIDVSEWTQGAVSELTARMEVPATARRKGAIAFSQLWGAASCLEARPKVIIFPRVTWQASSKLIPMSLDEALVELAPNVLLTEAASSQAHLSALSDLAEQCRCYRLDAGSDLERLPSLVLGTL
jgi:hypothetical protein